MQEARYYREKAAQARGLAKAVNHPEALEQLLTFAKDYEEIALDLERGAIEITHPDRMPQR